MIFGSFPTTTPKAKLFSRHVFINLGWKVVPRFSRESVRARARVKATRNQRDSFRIIFTRTSSPSSFTDTPRANDESSIVTFRIRNVTQLELVSGNQNKIRPKTPPEFKNIEKLSTVDTAMALDSNSLHCAFKGLHAQL